jgi:hypothetical protein
MANTYTLISSNTVGVLGALSVTFSSIPSTYTDLKLVISARDARADVQVSNIYFNFNSSGAGTNYSGLYMYGTGSSTTSSTAGISSGAAAFSTGAINTSSTFGNAEVYIPNYTSSNYKSLSSESSTENNGTAGFNLLLAGLWSNTAAITSIVMTPLYTPFSQYSTFYLYGISNS